MGNIQSPNSCVRVRIDGGLVGNASGQVARIQFQVCASLRFSSHRIWFALLNKGDPPIGYPLNGATYGIGSSMPSMQNNMILSHLTSIWGWALIGRELTGLGRPLMGREEPGRVFPGSIDDIIRGAAREFDSDLYNMAAQSQVKLMWFSLEQKLSVWGVCDRVVLLHKAEWSLTRLPKSILELWHRPT